MKKFKKNFVFVAASALTALTLLTTSIAGAVDRVGSGDGRTVELALVQLNKKVPGADNFQKLMYAFEKGSKIDVAKFTGLWSGITMWKYHRAADVIPGQVAGIDYLALNTIPVGPILGALEKVDFCRGYVCGQPSASDPNGPPTASFWALNPAGPDTEFDGISLLVKDSAQMEFRAYKGVIVGVSRPYRADGGEMLCRKSKNYNKVDNSDLEPAEPNTCEVFYLYNKGPLK